MALGWALLAAAAAGGTPQASGAGEGPLLEGRALPALDIKRLAGRAGGSGGELRERKPRQRGPVCLAALTAGRADTDPLAPVLVKAALTALGKEPQPAEVAEVVRAAVKAAPDEVLEIVRAAVKSVPRSEAKTVVAAAVSAVPDPQKTITVGGAALPGVAGDGRGSGRREGSARTGNRRKSPRRK